MPKADLVLPYFVSIKFGNNACHLGPFFIFRLLNR